jgi:hypothetical protein
MPRGQARYEAGEHCSSFSTDNQQSTMVGWADSALAMGYQAYLNVGGVPRGQAGCEAGGTDSCWFTASCKHCWVYLNNVGRVPHEQPGYEAGEQPQVCSWLRLLGWLSVDSSNKPICSWFAPVLSVGGVPRAQDGCGAGEQPQVCCWLRLGRLVVVDSSSHAPCFVAVLSVGGVSCGTTGSRVQSR